MLEDNRFSGKKNRRSVLKSLGAVAAFSTVGVSGSRAQRGPSLRKKVEQSHRILQNHDVNKQHDFLRNRGIATAVDKTNMTVPEESNDGISTQTLVKDEISLSFSLFTDCKYYDSGIYAGDGTWIAELSWEYNESSDDFGDDPLDYVGIGWDNNTWNYEDGNTSDVDSSSSNIQRHSAPGNGQAWDVADGAILDGSDDSTTHWTNVDVKWNGDDSEKDNSTISAGYTHTWSQVTVDGISVGFPAGVSVSVKDESKSWYKHYEDNGDYMELTYNDASGC
jgi:hypothetical protein